MSAHPDDWKFYSFPETAKRFGLSMDAIAALTREKTFPVFSRKICPALMKEWLLKNGDRLKEFSVS